jgi:single-strand DNA-binding protein
MAGRSVNRVILLGHLGRDAETKYTPSQVAFSRFSVATNRRVKDSQTGDWRDETDWHNVVLWRNENVLQYLTKGRQVYIEGRLQTRQYEDQSGQKRYSTEVVAEDLILLGGRGEGGMGGEESYSQRAPARQPQGQGRTSGAVPPAPPDDFGPMDPSDDVPF